MLKTYHLLIILPHFTILYAFEVVYIYLLEWWKQCIMLLCVPSEMEVA